MASRPAISVVMTVHNGGTYLREAIDSILAQSLADFDFIIVDDGSTDHSAAQAAAYGDPRIVLLRRPHEGLVAALNAGLARSRGALIARMDADDRARPERLALQQAYLQSRPDIGVLCSDIAVIDGDGRVTGHQRQPGLDNAALRDALLYRQALKPVVHPSVMMRRAVVERLGGYRAFEAAEDHDFWLRAVDHFGFARMDAVLLDYRIHAGGVSRLRQARQATSGAMSAVDYLVRAATGTDLFETRPELFRSIEAEVAAAIARDVIGPALAFRTARQALRAGRPIAGGVGLAAAFARHGTAMLPSRTLARTRAVVEDAAARAAVALRAGS